MKSDHTFHIPVMGTGFSIDTPAKVAKYGISSVISLVDDTLLEQMRELYYKKTGESYTPIMKHDDDFRARRITAYLNLMNRVVRRQFADLKSSEFDAETEITKYFILLPDSSPLKILYKAMLETDTPDEKESMRYLLRNSITCGDICVNIMTKLDRINLASKGQQPLPVEYSDALSALRGYAKSELHSAIVFSAGINRRLYNYIGNFNDFFPDRNGEIEKRRKLGISRPGSGRPKGHLVSNTEFTKEPICIASRQYQKLKIESLKAKKLNRKAYQQQFDVIVDKSCICNDLGAGVLKKNNISKGGKKHSAVCPGPNITSFSRVCTLRELVDHIYGKSTIRNDDYQPHMFVAELQLYVKHYMSEMHKSVQRQ